MICSETGLLIKPSYGRFIYWKLVTLIPFGIATLGIARYAESMVWLLVYFGLCATHMLIVYTNKCPHCAYYHQGGRMHRCSWLWHVPKLVKPKPGPQGKFVTKYVPYGMATLTLYPTIWLWHQWELLAIFLLSIGLMIASIIQIECSRCISFQCGNNRVSESIRKAYTNIYSSETASQ